MQAVDRLKAMVNPRVYVCCGRGGVGVQCHGVYSTQAQGAIRVYVCISCPQFPPCCLNLTPGRRSHTACTLQGRPRCLPECEAVVRVIKPLLSALGYLHEQGIIHR